MPPAIRRAESCDSVASDSSVLEMQPDMPKIGQLEFALEYDRYSIKTIAFDADNDLKIPKRVPVCVNHSFLNYVKKLFYIMHCYKITC